MQIFLIYHDFFSSFCQYPIRSCRPPVFHEVLNYSLDPGRKSVGLAKIGDGSSLARAGCIHFSKQILRTTCPLRRHKQGNSLGGDPARFWPRQSLGPTILPGSNRKGGKWISSVGHPKIPQRGGKFLIDYSISFRVRSFCFWNGFLKKILALGEKKRAL